MLKKITILAIAILSVGSGYAQKSDAHKHVKPSQEAIQKDTGVTRKCDNIQKNSNAK